MADAPTSLAEASASPPPRPSRRWSARAPTAERLVGVSVLMILGAGFLGARGFPAQSNTLALVTGALAGAAAAGGAAAIYFLIGPMRAVAKLTKAIGTGDLPPNAGPLLGGDDEIADLGRALRGFTGTHGRSMEKLRGERDLFERILDGMGEGVLVLDGDERIVHANQALRAMARLGEAFRGVPLLEGIRSAALKEALDAARRGEHVAREIELGRPMPRKLLARVSPLGDKGRDAEGWMIVVFHDVTDLRRLETIRTDFVANVSHELRTPVTAISTAAETLLGGALDDPDEALEFVGVIDRHSKRLRQLVDDLLDLAKLEAKNFRLVLSDQEVRPILEHAIGLTKDAAGRRKMSVTLAPGGEGVRARIDRRALEQVVTNLLDNAVKYAGEGARVVVMVTPVGDRVEITVADDGLGISPSHLGRIFERFYRVDAGRSRELGGTGLGLSIVKHLVELMGGTVGVDSEPGKGARFMIRVAGAGARANASTPSS